MIARYKQRAFAAGTKHRRFAPAVVFLPVAIALLIASGVGCRASSDEFPIQLEGVAPEVAAAVKTAQSRIVADPKSAANFLTLGMVCEANGLTREARRAYERSVALDDRQAKAWYRLAVIRGHAGEIEGALAAIDRSIATDGAYAPSHWRRGLWLLDRSNVAGARAAFEKATIIDPANPGGWVGLARVALAEKRANDAVDVLEKFLAQHPGDRYALHLLGTAYQRLGRKDEAEYALAMAGPGEPVWPDPWSDELHPHRVGFAQMLKQATAQLLNGNYTAAVPLLEHLRRQRPADVSLMQQLGLSYVAAGRSSDGLELLRRALDRDPDNLETHLRLASAYLNTRDLAQALTHAEHAVALSPELGRAHEAKGLALWRSGRPAEALGAFQQALRYDPMNMSALIWMGWILVEDSRSNEALAHFESAAEKNPRLADAFVGIGVVGLQQGRLDEAEAALERASMLEPQNPRLAEARARLDAAKSRTGRRE